MNIALKSPRAKKRAAKWRLSGMIKLEQGCADCGYNKSAYALQFDHIFDNKKASVSNLIRSDYGWATILKEINKCEVVCANCHAIRTHARGQHNSQTYDATSYHEFVEKDLQSYAQGLYSQEVIVDFDL